MSVSEGLLEGDGEGRVCGGALAMAMGGGVAPVESVGETAGRGRQVSSGGADLGPEKLLLRRIRRGDGAAEDRVGGGEEVVVNGEDPACEDEK